MADPRYPYDPNDPYADPNADAQGYDQGVVDELGPPPVLDFAPIQYQEPTTLQRLFEGFSGLEGQPQTAPHNFAEGLVQGVGRGLGSAGTRAQAKREAYNATAERRQLARDQENLAASREYRGERRKYLGEKRKTALEDKEKQAKYERENPPITKEFLADNPHLQRMGLKVGDRIPASVAFAKPSKPDEPLEYMFEGIPATRTQMLNVKIAQQTQANKPATPQEQKTGGYYEDAKSVSDSIKDVERRLAKSKGVGAYAVSGPRALQSPDQKAHNDAVTAFANDLTYAQSGAQATPHEVEAARNTYFWVPGDNEVDLARKDKLRDKKLEELRKQGPKSGEGLTPVNTPNPASLWEP